MNNNSNKYLKQKYLLIMVLQIKFRKIITYFEKSKNDLFKLKQKYIDLNDNNNTLDDAQEYNNNWTRITRQLMSKNFINQMNEFLLYLNKYILLIHDSNIDNKLIQNLQKNSKQINTLYTLALFPKIVCNNNVKYKDQLINLSIDLFTLILNMSNKDNTNGFIFYKLGIKLFNYIDLFNKWQEFDKEYMTYTIAKQYLLNEIKMSTPLSNVDEHQQIYMNAFRQEQNMFKNELKYFATYHWKSIFNQLISTKDNYDKLVKYIYWLDVEYNLYKEPPNLEQVLTLFQETKRLFINLVPRRQDIVDEINDIIDDDIIKAVLKESEIDQGFYFRKCEYILEKLKELQSASMDKKLEEFKMEFSLKIQNREYFRDLIPFFFKFVLNSLEKIHEDKDAFIEFEKKNSEK